MSKYFVEMLFVTGIPLTYSTASPFISSKYFSYFSILFLDSFENIGYINTKHNMIGIKQINPKSQSKLNNKIKNTIGVTIAPVKSNN